MVSHMNSKANSDLSTVENRSTDGNVDILVGAAVIPPPDNQTLLAMRLFPIFHSVGMSYLLSNIHTNICGSM